MDRPVIVSLGLVLALGSAGCSAEPDPAPPPVAKVSPDVRPDYPDDSELQRCTPPRRLITEPLEETCVRPLPDGSEEREGPHRVWYDAGHEQRATAGYYFHDRKTGRWIEWYPSGKRRSALDYWDGEAHGRWYEWHETGALKTAGQYRRGEETGVWTLFWEDGTEKESGPMRRGERQGVWTGWHPGGELWFKREYDAGDLDHWQEWNVDGVLVSASEAESTS